ncbi:uncharacterized protein LOC126994880 [Eriocheir sinensis]|uniref:uncharacterized protein LOC126994880 n=1 Tax=Eriocheir sinensis TaxID=95602 RepID=UPI0021C61A3C|nr:uncharacterized protein LOC126994880 [Eriocheir sinensis]
MEKTVKEEIADLLGPWESEHCPDQQRTDTDQEDPRAQTQSKKEPQAGDTVKMEELEEEVDFLKTSMLGLVDRLRRSQEDSPTKPLLKPRDIPILERRHLKGVEGGGRLEVFLSQIEQCTPRGEDRKRIALSRVDAELAVYIQSTLKHGPVVDWEEFKISLIKELTDQSKGKVFDALNDLKYSYEEDATEFVTQLKCKFALLEVKSNPGEVPKREKLIKTKLLKGMPRDSRDRLEIYMDNHVPLDTFMEKLEVERLVALARKKDSVFMVTDDAPPAGASGTGASPVTSPKAESLAEPTALASYLDRIERRLERWEEQKKQHRERRTSVYCPYCRSTTHDVQSCFKNPLPGSCFDCLRMNCRRGYPGCPGRKTFQTR